jgi:uncharacterized protein (TIGR03437 family)
MKTFAFLSILLPAAAFGQSLGQLVGPRVAAILGDGVQGGGQGVYLKQVNGPLLAVQNDRVVFDPANTASIMALLYAMEVLRSGAITLDTPIARYLNGANSCPNPPQAGGTEPLSTALREMMWHSDNARTHAVQSAFQRTGIDKFSQLIGLRVTTQPQIPGCQTPGRTTLGEMGALWEFVALGNLPTYDRRTFLGLLAGKAQALAESTDYDHIWETDIPNMIRKEAPQGITQAQMTQYQNTMDLQYKSGAAVLCSQSDCTNVKEDRSLVGVARIPYCSGGLTVAREYVFGVMITGAIDTAWSTGKETAAQRAFNKARAELLRELIRDGMGSCYGGDAVLVTPPPNSPLTSRTTVFSWSNAANATGYRLDIGTVPAGTQLGTIFTTGTNAVVTNLPCNNSVIYARLWTRTTEQYVSPKDYSFRACSQGGPIITDPVPGSTIGSSTVTFKWTAATDADSYRFAMGSTLGGSDLDAAEPATNNFTTNNLPTDGRVIYVRVQAHTEAGFGPANDFAFNNLTGSAPAVASVVNAVTKLPNLSPACPAVLTGANFAGDTVVTISGTRAQVVGTPAGGQLTFIVPSTASTGSRTVVISSGGATSLPFSISLADVSPAVATPLLDAGGSPLAAGRTMKPGETVVLRAVGLGPLGSDGRPLAKYTVEVGGVPAAVTTFTSVADAPGFVQIGIVVPVNAPAGTQQVVVKAGTSVSGGVPLLIAGPAIAGVLNGASFDRGGKVAPGSLVALFGSDLATGDKLGMFPEVVLPGGGVITIAGVTAPLFDVVASAGQINLLVPFEAPTTGTASVVVTNALGTSSALQLQMAPAAPGIFRIGDPNNPQRKNAAALVANTAWRTMPSSMAAALGMPLNCKAGGVNPAAICGEPAAAGDPIQIYVTGLGRATANGAPLGNTLRTGDVAPANGIPLYRTVEKPRVTIGGIDADVAFSGIAPGFAGLYQINVTIPRGAPAGDDVPVVIEIGGASDSATIAIRQ